MKKIKLLSYGTIVWLIVFLIDYVVHLFQIDRSGVVTTLTGLKITTTMTSTELFTKFSLTLQTVIVYVCFIVIWMILCSVLQAKKKHIA
ncbi:hypothetical protein ACWG0P_03645 [Amedibacillus sp. YH-ame6]